MSVVIHVGQCGNQLGDAFWRLAADTCDAAHDSTDTAVMQKKMKENTKSGQTILAPKNASSQPALYGDQFFHTRSRRARCICVDTEPKVIRSVLRSCSTSNRWYFEPAHVHYEQSGRGNNWAMGYNFQTHQRNVIPSKGSSGYQALASVTTDSKTKKKLLLAKSYEAGSDGSGGGQRELVEQVMDSLRIEIEALDVYRGSMMMHSLGGGTGAGLGCRLLETIRDVYPRSYLGAVSIAPSCASGDTPLQNYNALFTLQHLQEHTDVVIYKENDELMKTALYWKALVAQLASSSDVESSTKKRVTLREMNALVAADVAGLVFPTVSNARNHGLGGGRGGGRGGAVAIARPFDLAMLVSDCCPMPAAKFLDVRTGILRDSRVASGFTNGTSSSSALADPLFHALPTTLQTGKSSSDASADTSQLDKLAKWTLQSYPRFTSDSRAIGASAVVRSGSSATTTEGAPSSCAAKPLVDMLSSGLPRLHLGNSIGMRVSSSHPPFQSYGGKAAVSIALNHGHATSSIRHFLDRGHKQFRAGAYTHWYKQHGLEDGDFETAFEQCTQIVKGYDELLCP